MHTVQISLGLLLAGLLSLGAGTAAAAGLWAGPPGAAPALLVGGLSLGALGGSGWAWQSARRRRAAAAAAARLRAGDLQERIGPGAGFGGELARALEGLRSGTARAVREVRAQADALEAAGVRLLRAQQLLAEGAERQASARRRACDALAELGAALRRHADQAREAARSVAEAADAARRSQAEMAAARASVQDLAAAARRIDRVVAVVDGIAFRTASLAHGASAAAEAPRIPPAALPAIGPGAVPGPAVVAEVRSLARRSAEAARDMRQRAAEGAGHADAAPDRVAQAGAALDRAARAVDRAAAASGPLAGDRTALDAARVAADAALEQLQAAEAQAGAARGATAEAAADLAARTAALRRAVAGFRLGSDASADTPEPEAVVVPTRTATRADPPTDAHYAGPERRKSH
ncbi:MAG: hypothetical protein PGN26_00375 [Xylophilus ampelinus]